jgi:hypothetical protein
MSFLLSYYPILSVVPVAANDLPQEGPYRLGDLQVDLARRSRVNKALPCDLGHTRLCVTGATLRLRFGLGRTGGVCDVERLIAAV